MRIIAHAAVAAAVMIGAVTASAASCGSGTHEAPDGSSDQHLRATVIPDRLVWTSGEAIRGTVFIENTGHRAVPRRDHWGTVIARETDGSDVRRSVSEAQSGCVIMLPPALLPQLQPGERCSFDFALSTNVLGDPPAWRMLGGRTYALDFVASTKGPLDVIAAPVMVRHRPDAGPSRVVAWLVQGGRLVLLREEGEIEVYTLDGRREIEAIVEECARTVELWDESTCRRTASFEHVRDRFLPAFDDATGRLVCAARSRHHTEVWDSFVVYDGCSGARLVEIDVGAATPAGGR